MGDGGLLDEGRLANRTGSFTNARVNNAGPRGCCSAFPLGVRRGRILGTLGLDAAQS